MKYYKTLEQYETLQYQGNLQTQLPSNYLTVYKIIADNCLSIKEHLTFAFSKTTKSYIRYANFNASSQDSHFCQPSP